jgi:hypothetical protein
MSVIHLVNNHRFKISESELSETLNTTVFNITTYVTAGNLLKAENIGDLIDIKGKIYILIDRIANLRSGYISF